MNDALGSLVSLACGRCGAELAPSDGEVVIGCGCGAAWRGSPRGLVEQAVLRASPAAATPWWAFRGPPVVKQREGGTFLGIATGSVTWRAEERIWVPAWDGPTEDVVARAVARTKERGEPADAPGAAVVAGVTRPPEVARGLARLVVVLIEADAAGLSRIDVTLPDGDPELWLLDG